jgi:hypothetical protein
LSRNAFHMLDRTKIDHVADALLAVAADDALSPVAPIGLAETIDIPCALLDAVLADARCQQDRARGESALAAPSGTVQARAGDGRVAIWRAQNQGIAALLDLAQEGIR